MALLGPTDWVLNRCDLTEPKETLVSLLRVIDIETTGLTPPAEIIEIGRVDIVDKGGDWVIQKPIAKLYRPVNGIPPETMAVHHIKESDIPRTAEPCTPANIRSAIMNPTRPDVLVAHNCAFERTFISDLATDNLPWICTYKCALQLWPDAPGHTNQILRYWRGLVLDDDLAMPPHRAAPDAWVTAHLLLQMLHVVSVEKLIGWTAQPKFMPKVPFGKYRNKQWADVPIDYLSWFVRQSEFDADTIWNATQELERRRARQ